MNVLNGIRHLRSKCGITVSRDTGGARFTVALRGRPFAKVVERSPVAVRFEQLQGPKLNVGGGKGHPRVPGWQIVDLRETADIRTDITREPLPFSNDTVGIIFTSHTLEHIFPQHLDFVLSEFHRVLRPENGLLRIAVPDISLAIDAYVNRREDFFHNGDIGLVERNVPIAGLLASWMYSTRLFKDPDAKAGHGHVHCFDADYLGFRLRRVGFRHVWRSTYLGSAAAELRTDAFDRHPHDSLFIEAMK
jgi:predicted SAM-dependent methyltransferase